MQNTDPNIYTSMAKSVENAAAVIVCMSKSYCISENCKLGNKKKSRCCIMYSPINLSMDADQVKQASITSKR